MISILEFLDSYEEIDINIFDEDTIFNKPIEVYFLRNNDIGVAKV